MPETMESDIIDQTERTEMAYNAASYYAMKLKIDLNDRRKAELRNSFDEFRYAFLGLYSIVRHKKGMDAKVRKAINRWSEIETKNRSLPIWFYVKTLRLYDRFVDDLPSMGVFKR